MTFPDTLLAACPASWLTCLQWFGGDNRPAHQSVGDGAWSGDLTKRRQERLSHTANEDSNLEIHTT